MLTRCPHCQSILRAQESHLQRLDNRVRCGQCDHIFDALYHQIPESTAATQSEALFASFVPDDQRERTTQHQAAVTSPVKTKKEDKSNKHPSKEAPVEWQPAMADAPSPTLTRHVDLIEPDSQARESIFSQLPQHLQKHRSTLLISLFLLIPLSMLATHKYAHVLGKSETLHPVVNAVCQFTGCQPPLRRQPELIKLRKRTIYSHPSIDGALVISISIENQADFAQPFPLLNVSMSDRTGRTVVRRVFKPTEYLEWVPANGVIRSGQIVNFKLEIKDPGRDAMSFELEFM